MPTRLGQIAAGLAAACAAALPARAVAYRPFDGTDAAVAERGTVELELEPLGWIREGPDRSLVAPSAVVNWGFARAWEAVLEARHVVRLGEGAGPSRFHLDDTALSAKHVLRAGSLQGRPGPSVAVELGVLLPNLGGEHGGGASATLIASRRWRPATLHLNGGVAVTRAHAPAAVADAILELHDAWKVHPAVEGSISLERGRVPLLSALAGGIWRLREGLALDAAIRVSRAGATPAVELRAGFTWTFGGAR